MVYTNNIYINILRGGLQSPRGGFKEGPLKNKTITKGKMNKLTAVVKGMVSRLSARARYNVSPCDSIVYKLIKYK